MTDKNLVKKRFAGAGVSYDSDAVVQKEIAVELASLIRNLVPSSFCSRVLEIGCGTGMLTRELVRFISPEELYLNDICPEFSPMFTDLGPAAFIAGDAETVDFPSGLGLIASSSVIQWFSDPEGFFRKCSSSLQNGGYLAFSTFGPGNMKEIAEVTGHSLHYRSLNGLESMLASRYRTIHMSGFCRQLNFASPVEVLRHLKHTGVNALSRKAWTRKDLTDFCNTYSALFGTADGCTLTYTPVFVIARKM